MGEKGAEGRPRKWGGEDSAPMLQRQQLWPGEQSCRLLGLQLPGACLCIPKPAQWVKVSRETPNSDDQPFKPSSSAPAVLARQAQGPPTH